MALGPIVTHAMKLGEMRRHSGADVGRDDGTNVLQDYKEGDNAFTGGINKVTIGTK